MASKAVVDAVKARVADNFSSCPVFFPNDATTPPPDLSAFVVVEFPISQGLRVSYGARHQDTGTIRFVIHTALKTGIDTALAYGDELAALFRSVKFPPDDTGAYLETLASGSLNALGSDGGFYRSSFSTPYRLWFNA